MYDVCLSCSIQVDDCKLPLSRKVYDCILHKAIIKFPLLLMFMKNGNENTPGFERTAATVVLGGS